MKRILIVDDVELFREYLFGAAKSIFKDEPHEITVCEGKFEALGKISREPAFDVVITDLQMPKEEDGLSVVAAARKKSEATIIVVASGKADLESMGIPESNIIFRKPFMISDLAKKLAKLAEPAVA